MQILHGENMQTKKEDAGHRMKNTNQDQTVCGRGAQRADRHRAASLPAAVSPSASELISFMSTIQCPRCWVPSSICPVCPTLLPSAPPPPLPPPPRNTTVQSSSPANTQPAKQRNCHPDSNLLATLPRCLTVCFLAALMMPFGN